MLKSSEERRTAVFSLSHVALVLVAAVATAGVMGLWRNIMERKAESRQRVFEVVPVDEQTVDPAEWGKNFPRQYDSYRRTVDTERTRHGGSEAFQKLDDDPLWRVLFKGYAFGVDYREERGHAYMLQDQDETLRVTQFKQPGACLHCHASVLPLYRHVGALAGVDTGDAAGQVMKGFEVVCGMPYAEARNMTDAKGTELVQHPVTCLDCHEPKTMRLRVTRPALLEGLDVLVRADAPLPHLPSVTRWRQGSRARAYDVNVEASHQEMRTLVCAQCHVEYYFKGDGKRVTYPWHNGLKVEEAEAYYDTVGHVDWVHADSGANVLKAQHPEFELWSQGIHARSGVSCADCHMPYVREGAVKVSSHHVRSPLLDPARSCQTCHRLPEKELVARVEAIQDRTRALMLRAEEATVELIAAVAEAGKRADAPQEAITRARALHRQAQWRLDFVAAENSMGFHAPQESARILGEAIDLAHRGRIELLK